jgi:hypothetical protein
MRKGRRTRGKPRQSGAFGKKGKKKKKDERESKPPERLKGVEKDKHLKFLDAVQKLAGQGHLPSHIFTREVLEKLCGLDPIDVERAIEVWPISNHSALLSVIGKKHRDEEVRKKAKRLLKELSQQEW